MAFFDDLKTALTGADSASQPNPLPTTAAAPQKAPAAKPATNRLTPITIGGDGSWESANGKQIKARTYTVPPPIEPRHVLVTGTTGSGKSQFFQNIFDQVRERGDKAIIVDHGGESIARYYRPGDVILNPFDARFPGWNPHNEIREDFDHDNMARFIVPDGHGESAAWNEYAQSIYSSVSRICQQRLFDTSTATLLHYLLRADPAKMLELLDDEPAGALFARGSEKMAANARSILGAHLKPWRYFQPGDFSIREWAESDDDRRWVFVSYKESNFAALKGFISMAISIAINYTLDLKPSATRRIWFALDEMATLGKIGALTEGLAKLRKQGGCVVSGLQTFSQIKSSYGDHGATTLLANFNTWVALRPGDAETAEVFSKHFGEQEVWRNDFSDNAGLGGGGANQGESMSTKLHVQRVQTYTEIMMLDDLCAVVKFPGAIPVSFMKIPYSPRVENAAPYIPRSA